MHLVLWVLAPLGPAGPCTADAPCLARMEFAAERAPATFPMLVQENPRSKFNAIMVPVPLNGVLGVHLENVPPLAEADFVDEVVIAFLRVL